MIIYTLIKFTEKKSITDMISTVERKAFILIVKKVKIVSLERIKSSVE